ncbi:MAG: GTP-binding protein [Nocardiaceae bacterium]|nr:GTP-binding protein [Nocardiaceae bacterium]
MRRIPVIALTGYLGAGKTSLLNHVLRTPAARIGVVINDFGEINVDAGLVTGQVDEPASISGGCICCLDDEGGLDKALEKLANPKLGLDAIIVEASGLADPVALQRIIGFSGVAGVRPGGVVDVVDAVNHFETVDREPSPPLRYAASSLVVVNKLDQVVDSDAVISRVEGRVRERNPDVFVTGAVGGRIDPKLLFDVSGEEEFGQLSFRELLADVEHPHDHVHAASVSASSAGSVDPDALVAFLEKPPTGVYRIKGQINVGGRRYVVNVVGASIHIAAARGKGGPNQLVAIGMGIDVANVRAQLEGALAAVDVPGDGRGFQRYVRASA